MFHLVYIGYVKFDRRIGKNDDGTYLPITTENFDVYLWSNFEIEGALAW